MRRVNRGMASKVVGWTIAGLLSLNAGPFNRTGEFSEVQIGLFNAAKRIRGLQLGLLDRNAEAPVLEFFPIVNVGW
jgi:hypothetical protein